MRFGLLFLVVFITACTSQPKQEINQIPSQPQKSADELVKAGFASIMNRDTRIGLGYLDKAIEQCSDQYESKDPKYYAARAPAETLMYALMAAGDKQTASIVGPACADALYLKGYANIDLGNIEDAEMFLKRAVNMAPANSMYLSELGHIYQTMGKWEEALDTFVKSEKMASEFSPEELKKTELLRAKRGVGFSLIELGNLVEAEAKFKECLVLDPQDAKALNEIKYIDQLRNSKRTPAKGSTMFSY
jgi:tetratricopeptide (TPR) repeat protein